MNTMSCQAFLKVVEYKSITKAARALGYSQPGISHLLDSLEEETGLCLLIRSKSGIVLTEDGRKLLPVCRELITTETKLKKTAAAIQGLDLGSVRIGALNSMLVRFVPKVVGSFSNAYSNIEIVVREIAYAKIIEELQENSIDIGFTSAFSTPGLQFTHLFYDPVCLVLSKSHPFNAYDRIPLHLLNGCDFIMPMPGWDDPVKTAMEIEPFRPNIKHYVASDTAGIAMATENLGVYVISKTQSGLVTKDAVIKDFEEDIHRDLGFGINSCNSASVALQTLIKNAEHLAKDI